MQPRWPCQPRPKVGTPRGASGAEAPQSCKGQPGGSEALGVILRSWPPPARWRHRHFGSQCRESVPGADLQEGVLEEKTLVGEMLGQTDAEQRYTLDAVRHDCDNGKGVTTERFA